MRFSERTGALFVLLSAVIFGLMPLLAKTAYSYGANEYTVAFGRFLFGAAGSGTVIALSPKISFRVSAKQLKRLLLLSVIYAGTPVLLYGSYKYIGTGLATTLHFTYPVTIMLLGTVIFRERLRPKQLICLLICAAGIILLYRPGQSAGTKGIVIALISGVTYALYVLILGKSGLSGLSVMSITFWISMPAAASLAAFSAIIGRFDLALPWQAWAAFALLGIVATVIALALFQTGVFLCGAVKASLLSTFEPLMGVVIGAAVFGEGLDLRIITGMVLILASTVLLVLQSDKSGGKTAGEGEKT